MFALFNTLYVTGSHLERTLPTISQSQASPRRQMAGIIFSDFPEVEQLLHNFILMNTAEICFDTLTQEELIQEALFIKKLDERKDKGLLEQHDKKFVEAIMAALARADQAHDSHQADFDNVTIDADTGITLCTADQLKLAIRMARGMFPGLTALARNNEQICLISRLVQTILLGLQPLSTIPLPRDPLCFAVHEAQRMCSPPQNIQFTPGTSFFKWQLNTLIKEGDIEAKCIAAVGHFIFDMVSRPGISFSLGDCTIHSCIENECPQQMATKLLGAYAEHLLTHPGSIQDHLMLIAKSDFFHDIRTTFRTEDTEESGHPLPSKIIKMILAAAHIPFEPLVCNLVPLEKRNEIMTRSSCTINELNILFQAKLIEFIFLLNQASCATPWSSLIEELKKLSGETILPFIKRTHFTLSGDHAETYQCSLDSSLGIVEDSFKHLEFPELIQSRVIVASATTTQTVLSIYEENQTRCSCTVFSDLRFGWKIPSDILDSLIQKVNIFYIPREAGSGTSTTLSQRILRKISNTSLKVFS